MEKERESAVLAAWGQMRWKAAAAFILMLGVYLAVYALWHVPLEPALYAALLCAVPAGLLAVKDYVRFRRRHAQLREQLRSVGLSLERLPEPADRLEQDYQELLTALLEEKTAMASESDRQYGEMLDYYTLWAHQIKTPIAAMDLLLQAHAPAREPGDEPVKKEEISQELFKVEQYADMVLQYLRLAGMSSDLSFASCRLDDLIRQAVRKYAPVFIRKRITLRWEAEDVTVLTDEKWLVFVLEQLLSNALKYTPSGGTVSLYMAKDAPAALVLEDTGIGIRAEDLPRLFEKGFTGLNGRLDKKATGLGLYLVSRIFDKLGHGIAVTSAPGRGTRVCMDLSRAKPLFD